MRKVFALLTMAFMLTALTQAQNSTLTNANDAVKTDASTGGVFEWVEEVHDFGTIPQSIPVSHNFKFKNVGDAPLIVKNVQKTCGCTVTDWTKEPVLPGQGGFVEAQFNAARAGAFNKGITVQSTASEPNKKLFFKGTVEAKADDGSVPEKKSIFAPKN